MPGNSTSPTISIILPTYNRAALIGETIASVRLQTYTNWELIIVDDGSVDNTEEVVAAIGDHRIRFYKAGRIGIGGTVKNIGLEKATGELIAFIDSDDLWAPAKLEKQVKALQQYPEAGFSLTGGYNFRQVNVPVEYFYKQREGIKYDSVFISCFKSEVASFTQALMMRKDCLEKTGWFTEAGSFSDVEFIVRLAFNFKAVILYEPLVYRRLHDENYINDSWEKSYYEGIGIIKLYEKNLEPFIAEEALYKLYINFGESCLEHKEKGKAIQKFLIAWNNKPMSIVPLKKIAKAMLRYIKR
jgi:glycosyltransferase involved in cell wall biosynthesis